MNQNYHTHWDTLVHVFVIVCEFCKISEASFMICVTQLPYLLGHLAPRL